MLYTPRSAGEASSHDDFSCYLGLCSFDFASGKILPHAASVCASNSVGMYNKAWVMVGTVEVVGERECGPIAMLG